MQQLNVPENLVPAFMKKLANENWTVGTYVRYGLNVVILANLNASERSGNYFWSQIVSDNGGKWTVDGTFSYGIQSKGKNSVGMLDTPTLNVLAKDNQTWLNNNFGLTFTVNFITTLYRVKCNAQGAASIIGGNAPIAASPSAALPSMMNAVASPYEAVGQYKWGYTLAIRFLFVPIPWGFTIMPQPTVVPTNPVWTRLKTRCRAFI